MKRLGLALLVGAAGLAAGAAGAPSPVRDYVPDYVFSGSQLSGWTPVGDVAWKAENGEIVATPRAGGTGGWLVFNKPLQDMAAFTQFKCADPCRAGLLLRAERTAEGGLRGYLAPFGSEVAELAEVTLDRNGKELSRRKLGTGNQQARFANPAGGVAIAEPPSVPGINAPRGETPPPPLVAPVIPVGGSPETAVLPPARPPAGPRGGERAGPLSFKAGAWNDVNAIIDTNRLSATVNWTRGPTGVTLDEAQSFGPFALYVGAGSGEVRFRNTAYKDLGRQSAPAERLSSSFRMQKLDDFTYAWDAAVADINHDGINDVVAGPYYYLGPNYTERREIYVASTYDPGHQYVGNMVTFAHDFTGDGWPDVLATEFRQLALYVNPKGEPRRWTRHVIAPGVSSELALMADLDKDGTPELIFVQEGRVAFAKPKRSDPTTPWPVFFVSDAGLGGNHSFGVGDINGDGRVDIVQVRGWWEQPAGGVTAAAWKFHATPFNDPASTEPATGGGVMSVVDVNGDGLADVITSLNAHGFGLGWFEQKRSGAGDISFTPHMLMGDFTEANAGGLTFSQLHAGAIAADLNRDGVIDFVTGKRRWAHLDTYSDPDPNGESLLVWYRGARDPKAPGGVRFTPEVIHNRSGVGSSLTVTDINKDGRPDIVTSGVHGTFVFWGRTPRAKK